MRTSHVHVARGFCREAPARTGPLRDDIARTWQVRSELGKSEFETALLQADFDSLCSELDLRAARQGDGGDRSDALHGVAGGARAVEAAAADIRAVASTGHDGFARRQAHRGDGRGEIDGEAGEAGAVAGAVGPLATARP